MPRKAVTLSPQERVRATLELQPVDRPPFSFWHPFGLQHMGGEALATACLTFVKRYRVDFLVVPLCHQYPFPPQFCPERSHDFLQLEVLTGTESGWTQQVYALEEIGKRLRGKRHFLQQLPSPWTLLDSIAAPELLQATMREHPGFLHHALETTARSLGNLAQKALNTGAAGVLLQVTGATHELMSANAYRDWCGKWDRHILEVAAEGEFNLVQAQARRLHFRQLTTYPAQAISWPWNLGGPGLKKGRSQWSKAIAGGLDETRLHKLTRETARRHLLEILEQLQDVPGPLLTPSGSLDPRVRPEVLEEIRDRIEKASNRRRRSERT